MGVEIESYVKDVSSKFVDKTSTQSGGESFGICRRDFEGRSESTPALEEKGIHSFQWL